MVLKNDVIMQLKLYPYSAVQGSLFAFLKPLFSCSSRLGSILPCPQFIRPDSLGLGLQDLGEVQNRNC